MIEQKPKEQSQRQRRVAELVRQIVAEKLAKGETQNPSLGSHITVTRVEVSKDIKHAKVFFTPLLQNSDHKQLTEELNLEAPLLSRQLGKQMHTKYTPRLRFYYDESYESAQRLESIIRDIRDDA